MKDIHKEYIIGTNVEKVWDALTNPKTIEKWSGVSAIMSENIGFEFKLWGGDIWGKNIDVVRNQKLVQEWYGGKWNTPSIVTFVLSEVENGTRLVLEHVNVPQDVESFDSGWDDYYLGNIKKMLEN